MVHLFCATRPIVEESTVQFFPLHLNYPFLKGRDLKMMETFEKDVELKHQGKISKQSFFQSITITLFQKIWTKPGYHRLPIYGTKCTILRQTKGLLLSVSRKSQLVKPMVQLMIGSLICNRRECQSIRTSRIL